MNFENIPELKWENGYYLIVGLIAVTCVALYINFRRRDWL
jgi:magnesium transporter